ncbi:venom acid phosphatase Acph-1-like [Anthonomus grandis grandis]|uniref:venom acid phosphatase Acph-1-like n=1 Tax=Anthonomus grandis grandis TaxID=2921223 RepID=UPI0021655B67|nr:venom acid phosphatase Acph-1-like [Anthonomus grandis grandis]
MEEIVSLDQQSLIEMKITVVVLLCAIGCSLAALERPRPPRPRPPPPPTRPPKDEDTLVLVHTVFRHGDRTPNDGAYDSNPYSNESFYWPYGFGQLTNEGKRREYRIGETLRTRYNDFLGDVWNINILEARSTNVNRTKMSLQLMLAGLWPPTGDQIWQPWLDWQPIPYNYLSTDKELLSTFSCSNFSTLYEETLNSAEIQELLSVYDDVFEYVSNNTGEDFSTPSDIFSLYFESVAQLEYGYPLEPWLLKVFPETLEKITKDHYYIATNTTDLKKIAGGFLLKKIINDSKAKIDGLLTPQDRKMFIYSAHEINIATTLLTLGVYEDKIPAYGSHVLLELHQIRGVYGFKVFYHDWTTSEPYQLTIPGCSAFCPYDQFVELLAEVIPTGEEC